MKEKDVIEAIIAGKKGAPEGYDLTSIRVNGKDYDELSAEFTEKVAAVTSYRFTAGGQLPKSRGCHIDGVLILDNAKLSDGFELHYKKYSK